MPDLCEFHSESEEQIFTAHGQALPLLVSGDGAELVFMTYDMQNIVRFISPSSLNACGVDPSRWLHLSFASRLTDHPGNEGFLNATLEYDHDRVYRDQCEILDENGNRVGLTVWRRLILSQETPIGIVAIAKRIEELSPAVVATSEIDLVAVRTRISTLTRGERDVIDLVIQGVLNKTIATRLKIAIRTVESRRSKAMIKMKVTRLAELVRIWIAATEDAS